MPTEMTEVSDWEQKMKRMMNREDFKFRCQIEKHKFFNIKIQNFLVEYRFAFALAASRLLIIKRQHLTVADNA